MVDEEAAFDALMRLLDARVLAEVAVCDQGDWQDVATLGGVFTDCADEGPVVELDIFIDDNHALHLPWPLLESWRTYPAEMGNGAETLEVVFGEWRVRFTSSRAVSA